VAAKKSQTSSNIHVVVGTDEGMVREQALKLWRELTGGADEGFNHEVVEGNALKVDDVFRIVPELMQALMTYSMFGGDKVVWLRNATFFGSDRTSDSESVLNEVISLTEQLEKGLPDGVSLIISANKIDKRRAFWKFLEKNANVQVHDRIDMSQEGWEEQVAALVLDKSRAVGLQFESDALELFINLAGEATQQIVNELEKLRLYLGDRSLVTIEDVRVMVPLEPVPGTPHAAENPWTPAGSGSACGRGTIARSSARWRFSSSVSRLGRKPVFAGARTRSRPQLSQPI
jgi:DNA polymerase-3 subunit delta